MSNLKEWLRMFQDFLKCPSKFKDHSLEKESAPQTYKCTVRTDGGLSVNGDLVIKFEHLNRDSRPFCLTFSPKVVSCILTAMSHMFISSLCLPAESALVFDAIFRYFNSTLPMLEALTEIKNLDSANLYKIITTLVKSYQLQVGPGQITTILIRYERFFFDLFKARFCVEFHKLRQQQEDERAADAANGSSSAMAK
jgi:hypothetical protein